jgi:hypothetical protein
MTLDKDKILNIAKRFRKTLMALNIEFVDAGEGFLVAKMPVVRKFTHGLSRRSFSSISRKCGKCGFSVLLMQKKNKYVSGIKYRQII